MYAVAEVYETEITKIELGQKAVIVSESGGFEGEITGKVAYIGLQVGKQTLTGDSAFVTNSNKERIQVVQPFQEFELPIVEVRWDSRIARTKEDSIKNIIKETTQTSFDLGKSLLRIKLLKLSETNHILLINTHHMVSDRWQIGIFLREISTLYQAFLQQKESPLPELVSQYGDYAIWQKNKLKNSEFALKVSYWKSKLKDISVLELPCDYSRLPVPSYQGAKYPLVINKNLSARIKALSKQTGVTLFTLLLTAFKILLYRYSQQEDILIL